MSHWVQPFLDALRTTGNVSASAKAVSVTTAVVYTLRRSDADFAAAWDNALEDATDTLEAEARRRAIEGINEPVIYQGQRTPLFEYGDDGQVIIDYVEGPPGEDGTPTTVPRPRQLTIDGVPQYLTVNKRSDALLMFLLKGLRKKYGTETHELTGKDGAPLDNMDEMAKAARVAALMDLANKRKADVSDLA